MWIIRPHCRHRPPFVLTSQSQHWFSFPLRFKIRFQDKYLEIWRDIDILPLSRYHPQPIFCPTLNVFVFVFVCVSRCFSPVPAGCDHELGWDTRQPKYFCPKPKHWVLYAWEWCTSDYAHGWWIRYKTASAWKHVGAHRNPLELDPSKGMGKQRGEQTDTKKVRRPEYGRRCCVMVQVSRSWAQWCDPGAKSTHLVQKMMHTSTTHMIGGR